MQKKIKKILVSFIIAFIVLVLAIEIPTIADFGDYDSYDSSSSYDSWDSSSSSSSSSDSGSSSYSDRSYYSGGNIFEDLIFLRFLFETPIGWIIIILIIILIYYEFHNKNIKKGNLNNYLNGNFFKNYQTEKNKIFGYDDTAIENKIQEEDEYFNKSEFTSWASDMFIKLQYAWSDRNLEEVRYFMTPDLFERTNNQVQRYINNNQVNVLERVSVNIIKLKSYEHQGDRDILKVILDSKMTDYIIDKTSGKVIKGNPNIDVNNPYIMTFVRKNGLKTPEGGIKPVTMTCPNCGGSTTILSSGKCPYCGSLIVTRENNWTLSELSRYTPNS